MPGACRFTLPLSFPSFSPWNALFSPIQLPGYFLSHVLWYRNVHKFNSYIFDQGEMYWGLWMRCRNHHASYPSHTSCTLIVDIPWSQNTIRILFDDIFNDWAKETTKEYMKMMEYLSSLLPTASTKVLATWKLSKVLPNTVCSLCYWHRYLPGTSAPFWIARFRWWPVLPSGVRSP
jgi:hypothetical protein